MKHKWTNGLIALTLACVVGHASIADAAMINMLQTLMPAPGEANPVGGTVVGTLTVPVVTPSFTGSLTANVIANDTTNALGGLTFTYLLSNDLTSTHPIGRMTINGFEGFSTDASYLAPTTGRAPTLANRPVADVIGFSYLAGVGPGVLSPGLTSALLVIQTNAPAFQEDFASVINGFVGTVVTLAPVPEPATLALLTLGALVAFRRRR
jgi:hypothetical protein